ncbi:hypothetical protein [Altererythrobacter sp. Z27]|uniref:hypothetical protein n=1 Tax=Altererythrobacter sp. Z27 TaxID=3461147 RepID=UPI004044CC2A
MTTRKPGPSGKSAPAKRIVRPKATRKGPDRSGKAAKEEAAARRNASAPPPPSPPPPPPPPPPRNDGPQAAIDEAVAEAVKSGYDVLSQTIAQGRQAAEHFRQGEYNIRDVPHDLQKLTLHLLGLARQLSATTLDLCEQLVRQIPTTGGPPPPGEVAAANPPFRDYKPGDPEDSTPIEGGLMQSAPRTAAPVASAPPAGGMALSAQFTGTNKAKLLTPMLARPDNPTAVWQITATPLQPNAGKAAPIGKIEFEADLSHGGVIATIAVPKGQPPGAYSGLVFAKDQTVPLGALVIELGK